MTESNQKQPEGNDPTAVADQTFAGILGERWRTSGDGIYTLVDEGDAESADDVEAHGAWSEEPGDAARHPARRRRRRASS
jgi:hypothetical protein